MILRRYIHREIAERLGRIIGLLLLIIAGHRFIRYLAEAAQGALPAELIVRLALMKLLTTLPQLLPAALFLATVMGLSRLARDRELSVMSAAGGTRRVQLVSALQFSLPFSVLVFVTSFFIAPWAAEKAQELKAQANDESLTVGLRAGRFNALNGQTLYVERAGAGGGLMENVFLQTDGGNRTSVLNAAAARHPGPDAMGHRYVLFENGRRYSGSPGGLDYRITRYKVYGVLIANGTPLGPVGRAWRPCRPWPCLVRVNPNTRQSCNGVCPSSSRRCCCRRWRLP